MCTSVTFLLTPSNYQLELEAGTFAVICYSITAISIINVVCNCIVVNGWVFVLEKVEE